MDRAIVGLLLGCLAGCADAEDEASSAAENGDGDSASSRPITDAAGTTSPATVTPSDGDVTADTASPLSSTTDENEPTTGDPESTTGDPEPTTGDPEPTTGDETGDEPLSAQYPGDQGLADDPAVLFFDDFEAGWGRWDAPQADTPYLEWREDDAMAFAGAGMLRSSVTSADLDETMYISSQASIAFPERVDAVYVRFFAQFVGTAPTPHHWVRLTAGTPAFQGSGLANTVPPGDEGFWFDVDASTDDLLNFYVYWHAMRSGRCNDGSATPGCEGDQGTTYYYGNFFRPLHQDALPRDAWFCIEYYAKANTVGERDGVLALWVDDTLLGEYGPGRPSGTWLRSSFHEGGCSFSACTEPAPFEGFDFRTDDDVRFKAFVLDAYYERDSSANRREELEMMGIVPTDAQTILYDNVVIATQRIGCGAWPGR